MAPPSAITGARHDSHRQASDELADRSAGGGGALQYGLHDTVIDLFRRCVSNAARAHTRGAGQALIPPSRSRCASRTSSRSMYREMYFFWLANAISTSPSRLYDGMPKSIPSSNPIRLFRHISRSCLSAGPPVGNGFFDICRHRGGGGFQESSSLASECATRPARLHSLLPSGDATPTPSTR
jgi:hypothetical protein